MYFLNLLLLICLLFPNVSFAGYPRDSNDYINDFANLIDNSRETRLRQKLYDFETSTEIEISVVTIDSFQQYNTGAKSWEDFSTGLFNDWDIGNLPSNKGVLFLISKNDRKIRIELGSGYSKKYDARMKAVIADFIGPQLKLEKYTQGIETGLDRIMYEVTHDRFDFIPDNAKIIISLWALFSLIIALILGKDKKPGLLWLILGSFGFLILYIWRNLESDDNPDNRYRNRSGGGGSSSGGGASGGF